MTSDLTTLFTIAPLWSPQAALQLASKITAAVPGSNVEWDSGAGEDWAAILLGATLLGFVNVRFALALLSPEALNAYGLEEGGTVLVRVEDFDAPSFSATRKSIERLAQRPVSDALDTDAFSAKDLVWATI